MVRPRLRAVETIVVPDARHGKVLVLRDTQGIAAGHAVLPPALIPIVARFTGRLTCTQIAREVAHELGGEVETAVVEDIAMQLDAGLFLEGETFARALDRVRSDFAQLPSRPASHAGGAYPGERVELTEYIDHACIRASKSRGKTSRGHLRALISPHIDPWRGAIGYGHAYGALAASLAGDEDVDTFVVLGTSHAPMSAPFALCRKGYETPLGTMPVDEAFVDELAAAASFDPYADEFQTVFLKHVLGERRARIVPILAGLGAEQASGHAPRTTAPVARFLDALKEGIAKRGKRVVLVAGADMAHVGPRFGDPTPHDATMRADLERVDRVSLDLAARSDATSFWEDVASDLDERRVCGLAPIFSLLDALPSNPRGELLHYEQNIDPDDGSIVSYASLVFRD